MQCVARVCLGQLILVMAAAACVADAGIIFLSCFFFFLSFFPGLIPVVADWMSIIHPHTVWPWCEFRMQVEMYCTRLAENTGRKNRQKNQHLGTITQLCRAVTAVSFQSRHVSTIGKKLVKQQYLLHMSYI